MENLEVFCVKENDTIRSVMGKIAKNTRGIVFVCKDNKLLATVTDGDIRRYILAGKNIDDSVVGAAHYSPIFAYEWDRVRAESIMREKAITALPIVDRDLKILEIVFLNNFIRKTTKKNGELKNISVVIMAGGKGTRLKPFTDILPKPLIPLGEKTITEHIIEKFEEYGCSVFYMIVNYKRNFIKAYFADNEVNYNLRFVDENKFLGTAGGLKLLEGEINGNFFVSNCDILIEADYCEILRNHVEKECIITMVCARKKYQMPYGTVEEENGYVKCIREKPVTIQNINTGFYVVNSSIFDMIPKNAFRDMTELIESCISKNQKVGIYLIEEDKWLDIGQMEELEKTYNRLNSNS